LVTCQITIIVFLLFLAVCISISAIERTSPVEPAEESIERDQKTEIESRIISSLESLEIVSRISSKTDSQRILMCEFCIPSLFARPDI
jgi:hypothetical protein